MSIAVDSRPAPPAASAAAALSTGRARCSSRPRSKQELFLRGGVGGSGHEGDPVSPRPRDCPDRDNRGEPVT